MPEIIIFEITILPQPVPTINHPFSFAVPLPTQSAASLTADQGLWFGSLPGPILFVEIDCERISTVILFLPMIHEGLGLTSCPPCVWCFLVSLSHGVSGHCIYFWSLPSALLLLSELLCLCCVAALKSLPTHSFNALMIIIIPITFHYSFPWISSISYVPHLRSLDGRFSYLVV